MAFKGERNIDYYLLNPPGQPKHDIADYIEGNGVLVPRRYDTADDALVLHSPNFASQ
ncbi:MAG TPA: hypothetical protein VMR41_05410 [Patescibacteria group bacterium]|nr:hypothetical protein [Patescibacteria group bacterium]